MERARRELGVTFLNLDWVDSTSFEISDESLCECCRFIHSARTGGGSVLVHCAQVCPLTHTALPHIHTHSLSSGQVEVDNCSGGPLVGKLWPDLHPSSLCSAGKEKDGRTQPHLPAETEIIREVAHTSLSQS